MITPKTFAEKFAAKVFETKKGNVEIHIGREQLAMFLEVAIQTYLEGLSKGKGS